MPREHLDLPYRTPLRRYQHGVRRVPAADEALTWREHDPARWAALGPADKIWLAFYEALKAQADEAEAATQSVRRAA